MKRSLKILNFVLILCILMSISAYAGDYTVDIHGVYRHPVSGIIEDSGGEEKEALGQSMVDRIMSPKAYYEEANGSNYLTFSLSLMNSISDLSFDLDTGGGFAPTSHERIFDGDDIADIRVRVASKDSILRAKCFVEPMGRNVVFYIYCNNFTAGNSTSYPSLVSHDVEEQAPVQDNAAPVSNTEAAAAGFTEEGTGGASEISSDTGAGSAETGNAERTTRAATKALADTNADSVLDNADGLYLGEDAQDGSEADTSEDGIDQADIANNLMLDDSFWKTIFIFFITANLVSGIMLIAFYFAIKTVYDNRRYKKEKLRELFAKKEDPDQKDEFTDDAFYDLTYDDESPDDEFYELTYDNESPDDDTDDGSNAEEEGKFQENNMEVENMDNGEKQDG